MKIFRLIIISFIFIHPIYAEDSLTVQQAIQYAVNHNYGILISKNLVDIGKLNNSWANAGAYPVVSASTSKLIGVNNIEQKLNNGNNIKKNGAVNQNLNAGINVNWNILNGFKLFATKKRLEEIEKSGQYTFKKNLDEIIYNVVLAYFNIVKLKEQSKATQQQIQLYQDRLRIAEMKYKVGTSAKFELLQAEVDLNEQRSNLLTIHNSINIAKNDLYTFMGRYADTSYKVADTMMINPIPDLASVQNKINQQNPDILLANSNLEILRQTRTEINAGRLPTVILNGNYNFIRNASGAGFTLFNQTFGPSASIGLSVPLFTGGLIKRQLKVNEIQLKDQALTIDQMRLNANNAAHKAYLNYFNALEVIALEKNNLVLNTENVFIAAQRFKELNITSIELRQVQLSYIDAENKLFNALYQAKIAETELSLLTGDIENL